MYFKYRNSWRLGHMLNVLLYLANNGGDTKTRIYKTLNLSYPMGKRVLSALADEGLITVEDIGRAHWVKLTGEGRKVANAWKKIAHHFMGGLTKW